MNGGLSRRELARYDRDGIVFPVSVLSAAEVSEHREALASLAEDHFGGSLKRIDALHLFFGWAHRLATHPVLVDAIESILGPEILIYGSLVFRKPGRDPGYVSWHQDSAYSNLHLTPSVSAWIALEESNADTGCMQVIPGSHGLGALAHGNVRDGDNLLQRGECVDVEVDAARAVDVVLKPGEVSLHHSTLIHGSRPNTMGHARTGFIVRFVTNEFRCGPDVYLLRVRGELACSHGRLAEPPCDRDPQSSFAAWQAFPDSSGG